MYTEVPLSTLKSHLSHVLFASIYRNCEIRIKLVTRFQILVEASLEKNVYVKNKNMSPTELHNLKISSALKCTGNLQEQSYR